MNPFRTSTSAGLLFKFRLDSNNFTLNRNIFPFCRSPHPYTSLLDFISMQCTPDYCNCSAGAGYFRAVNEMQFRLTSFESFRSLQRLTLNSIPFRRIKIVIDAEYNEFWSRFVSQKWADGFCVISLNRLRHSINLHTNGLRFPMEFWRIFKAVHSN